MRGAAHSERVSASRFFLGGQTCARKREADFGWGPGARLQEPLAGCRGRAPAGGPGGGAPGRFWIYTFQMYCIYS